VPPSQGRVVQSDRVNPDEVIGPALERELDRLRSCRGTVAAKRRVGTGAVNAGTIELRFTVSGDGAAQNPEVVALTPTHPELLECVERRVSAWSFINTAGKPFNVERQFTFPSERETASR
jgi:hypothetical protein